MNLDIFNQMEDKLIKNFFLLDYLLIKGKIFSICFIIYYDNKYFIFLNYFFKILHLLIFAI